MADLIDHMTSRFLQWKLPDDFAPDGGINFTAVSPHGPIGTNLLTYTQAKAMVEYILDGAPIAALPAQGVRVRTLEWKACNDLKGLHEACGADGLYRNVWEQAEGRATYEGDPAINVLNRAGVLFDTLDAAKAAAQADYERRILAALEPAEAGGVEAHDEQLGVWADELMADLVLNDLMDLVDHEYDTKVGARRTIIDALKTANQAKVPAKAPAPVDAPTDAPDTIYLTEVDYEDPDFPLAWASASADSGGVPYHRADTVDALVKAAELHTAAMVAFWEADEAASHAEQYERTEDGDWLSSDQITDMRQTANDLWQAIPSLTEELRAALAAYRGEKP